MALYTAAYFTQRQSNAFERHIAYQQEYARVMARVRGIYRVRPGSVLDWGCGTGDFLELFNGWDRWGFEISTYAKQKCEAKGIKMVDYNTPGDFTGKFDLIIFRGVLQHLDDPFRALWIASDNLTKGGTIAILAQPDADSLCYRLFGDLPALDAPRNWWIPGSRELTNILHRLGFVNIEILRPYRGGPYAHPVRDFARFALRLVGIRKPFAFPGNMIELYAQKG